MLALEVQAWREREQTEVETHSSMCVLGEGLKKEANQEDGLGKTAPTGTIRG